MNRRSFLDRVPEYTFALAALVAPPLAVLVPLGMAVELPILGAISGFLLWWRGELRLVPLAPLVFVGLLLLWGGISLFWAPDPGHGAVTLLRVVALTLAGSCAMGMARLGGLVRSPILVWGIVLGLAAAAVLLALENSSGHALSTIVAQAKGVKPLPGGYKSQLTRGDAAMVLFVWPLALVVWRRRSALLGLLLAAIVVVEGTGDSLAAGVACAAGFAAMILVWLLPRLGPRLLGLVLVAATFALPMVAPHLPQPPESFVSLSWMPLSAHHRLAIWHYTGQRISEHRWRGQGMDAARADPGGDEELHITDRNPAGKVVREVTGARLPLHPHNAILQWWMELGLGGGLILAACLWWLTTCIDRCPTLDRPARAGLSALLVSGTIISCVSYGAWQSWWLASLWVAGAIGLTVVQRTDEP